MSKEKKDKKKKEKITYIDDGRSISDMSGTSGGFFPPASKKKKKDPAPFGKTPWQTYIESVKMMFKPMLIVIALIGFVFLLMYFSMR